MLEFLKQHTFVSTCVWINLSTRITTDVLFSGDEVSVFVYSYGYILFFFFSIFLGGGNDYSDSLLELEIFLSELSSFHS